MVNKIISICQSNSEPTPVKDNGKDNRNSDKIRRLNLLKSIKFKYMSIQMEKMILNEQYSKIGKLTVEKT